MAHRALILSVWAVLLQGSSSLQKFQPMIPLEFESAFSSIGRPSDLLDIGTADAAVLENSTSTCVPLKNRGVFSTVQLNVGNPPQALDVVADTGSNAVVINDCICKERGICRAQDACFKGTNRSSTFVVPRPVRPVTLHFGSGFVYTLLASDEVKLGSISGDMKDGLLLMYNHKLRFTFDFEGILGLGIPGSHIGNFDAPLFLQRARVGSFSLCMNTGADGVFRLGSKVPQRKLGSVGRKHWGTGLTGIGVGANGYSICTDSAGQDMPCAAIPDSGTTNIMGPAAQVSQLFGFICDGWARCADKTENLRRLAVTNPKYQLMAGRLKAMYFMKLLRGCNSFNLSELPIIRFKLADSDGQSKVLELDGWSYVMETTFSGYQLALDHLAEVVPSTQRAHLLQAAATEDKRKLCTPAFGVSPFKTSKTGPIWIMGTPLFYRYTVHFDLTAKPRPALAFVSSKSTPCGSCDASDLFASGVTEIDEDDQGSQHPRFVEGPFRTPNFNITDDDF